MGDDTGADAAAARGHAVTLADLSAAILLDPESAALASNGVRQVRSARTFDELETATTGDVVLLDSTLQVDTESYRFDLAIGRLDDAVAAIIGGRPSATARRTALRRGIALGHLIAGHDLASLAVLVRDLTRGREQFEVSMLEAVQRAGNGCTEVEQLDDLLSEVSRLLDRTIELVDARTGPGDQIVRRNGTRPLYISGARATDSALIGATLTQVARRIEMLFQEHDQTKQSAEISRSELLNEILLDDVSNFDAVRRLRVDGLPIDGWHCAVRVDCHDRSPEPMDATSSRDRQRAVGEAVIEAARQDGEIWTRAGTAASIVLVSSRRDEASDELVARDIHRAAERVLSAAKASGGAIHVGVGSRHRGARGLRVTVNEATIALRSAIDKGRVHELQHFDRLGFGRALMQWAEIEGVRPVVREILAPLLNQSPRRSQQAIHTLRVYLDTGRNITKTAEHLHLHRNSVHYRIERIRELLNVDLDDPDERLLLELGCRLFVTSEEPRDGDQRDGVGSGGT